MIQKWNECGNLKQEQKFVKNESRATESSSVATDKVLVNTAIHEKAVSLQKSHPQLPESQERPVTWTTTSSGLRNFKKTWYLQV